MLGNIDLDDKGYDQIREESIARIPMYSREWTNYNISDPGITILENFSAFTALQQSEINEVPGKIKLRLLALAGFTAREGICAAAYLIPKVPQNRKTPCLVPERMKLYAQNICFELEQCAEVREMCLLSVRADSGGIGQTVLLGREGVKGGLSLFGGQPTGGEAIYFFLNDIPAAGQKVAFFVELAQQFDRNPVGNAFGDRHPNPFAEALWEVETSGGYRAIAVEDGTHCFLQSGYVAFSLDEKLRGRLVKDRGENAYRMRVTLVRAAYDIVPRFQRICGLLVPAVQRDTRSYVMELPVKNGKVQFRSCLIGEVHVGEVHIGEVHIGEVHIGEAHSENGAVSNGYLEVYGKEADGRYHRYFDLDCMDEDREARKRFCRVEFEEDFSITLTLAKYSGQESGAESPEELPQEVLAVCRDSALMAYSSLGTLYGYDDQEIPLPDTGVLYTPDFSVLVVERSLSGDELCHVVSPGNQTAGEVCYHIGASEHMLVIQDCGRYEGAELRLGNVVFYEGDGGNIRAGTELAHVNRDFRLDFVNCADVADGSFAEDFEQIRRRFAADLSRPATMVTGEDCVQMIKNIPGLSIHKIGVCPVTERNEIHIVVKPNSAEAFPGLSEIYRQEINRYVEHCRLLASKVLITQPVYVPVHVRGAVSVRKHLAHSSGRIGQQIEAKFMELLDGVHTETGFGSRVVFLELYHCLADMDCVEEVLELSIYPGSSQWADQAGLDIQLKPNALYYPGDIRVEVVG